MLSTKFSRQELLSIEAKPHAEAARDLQRSENFRKTLGEASIEVLFIPDETKPAVKGGAVCRLQSEE